MHELVRNPFRGEGARPGRDVRELGLALRGSAPFHEPEGDYVRIAAAAVRAHDALTKLAGRSSAMQRVRRDTWAACFGDTLVHALHLGRVIHDHDVLILGETGTGKEGIATAIQEGTPGPDANRAPFAAINAAAIPETLIESELFGHLKGSFTGATQTRAGKIRLADGGCFFLDEVGDLPTTTQVKLLRVMETNEVTPLGADHVHRADARWVAATHKDLGAMVEAGTFRRDFHERLAGNVIRIPPLRERPEDIVDIGRAFVAAAIPADAKFDYGAERVDRWLARAAASAHPWPGNVRELQNALRDLLLGLEPQLGVPAKPNSPATAIPAPIRDGSASLRDVEDWYIRLVVERTDRNYAAAARILRTDRATVRRRARALGLP